jgi:glycosyltransferase involved in cell wall biosynthesis
MREPEKVVIVQTTVPDYRTPFFDALARVVHPSELVLLSGDEDWQRDVRHSADFPHTQVRNVFFARRQLLFQWGSVRPLIQAEVAVVGLNPRVVSSWIALVGRKLMSRRTLVWGHAWPRKGPSQRTDRLRSIMRRLASTLIVYTETEAEQLARMFPGIDVVAAPNALYSRIELATAPAAGPVTDVLYVGRLTPSKRPELLLEGFVDAALGLPPEVRLVVVGEGPLRPSLEERTRRAGLEHRVRFAGHVSSARELRDLYARAIVSVSPGPVGLALIQSLGFGVPMILTRDDRHGPEIEAAVDGVNVVMIEGGSSSDLATAIVSVVRDQEDWRARREAIAAPIRDRYSIERMTDCFARALKFDEGPDPG